MTQSSTPITLSTFDTVVLESITHPNHLSLQAITDQAKKSKNLQLQLKEVNGLYEDEQRFRDEQHELATKAERRANDLQLEIEELRTQIEQVQRALRTSDAEKTEAQERVTELSTTNSSLQSAKRKAEQLLATLQEEYEELEMEAKENGDKLRKNMEQSARLQSDYMSQKEHLTSLEKAKVWLLSTTAHSAMARP